jgi:pseudouridine-5'-phosphate glycosidase/pseudouridine kinase
MVRLEFRESQQPYLRNLPGFPYPDNVTLASHLESVVRQHGGVPATIGIVDGVARVGLAAEELTRLASAAGEQTTFKISRRDLGFVCGLV